MNGKDLKQEKASLRDRSEYYVQRFESGLGINIIASEMLREETEHKHLRLVCVNGKRIA